jgi:ATP-dependent DNA helicase RecQ
VYAATRRATEQLTVDLSARGLPVAAYHAGMTAKRRDIVQDGFMAGDIDVMVATVAFGMGVDKHDVRFVAHHDAGGSLDSYHQEIGRAGRDGAPAQAVLFYRPEDLGLRRFFASGGRVGKEGLRRIAEVVRAGGPVELGVLVAGAGGGMSRSKVLSSVARLEEVGSVVVEDGLVGWRPDGPAPEAAVALAAAAEERHRAVERSRVEMVQAYAESRTCRRQVLLAYFGEQLPEPCGNCDICDAGPAPPRAAGATGRRPGALAVDTHVRHATFGEGQIIQIDGDRLVVLFEDVGYKTLSVAAITERDLLVPF